MEMRRASPIYLRRKGAIRIAFLVVSSFVFYFFVFNSTPPTYGTVLVENYELTDGNVFHTVPFFKESTYKSV
jgi:hypothetical protein